MMSAKHWQSNDEHWRSRRVASAKRKFIPMLREKGVVRYACEAAGIHRATAYRWRDRDPRFAQAWDDAMQDCADAMEASVFERALAGDPILSMFWLKAHRVKFKDRISIDIESVQNEIEERLQQLSITDHPISTSFTPEVRLLAAPKDSSGVESTEGGPTATDCEGENDSEQIDAG